MKKNILLLFLSLVLALSVSVGVISAVADLNADTGYVVGDVKIEPASSNGTIYIKFYDKDGNAVSTGYNTWVDPDAATEAFEAQLLFAGKSLSAYDGVVVHGVDMANCLCISGLKMKASERIIIPSGTTFVNGDISITFGREFQIVFTGSGYNVIAELVFDVDEYEMPEGMLSDFTENSAVRLMDNDYINAAVNDTGGTWNVNYASAFFLTSSGYISEEEAPKGSTNGGYRVAWAGLEGLLFPSVMFAFPQKVAFNREDEIVFRFYLSETFDNKAEFWFTSSREPNIWDAQVRVPCMTLTLGAWNEVSVPVAEFLDEKGNIVPIAFTLNYGSVYTTSTFVSGAEIIFDTAVFRSVEKVIGEYEILDISEVVPVGDGKSFTGTRENYVDDFDYNLTENIGFARTDKGVDGIKAKLTINDLSQFSFYFVLNGTDLYFNQGGIFYWFTDKGIKVGYNGKTIIDEPLPASITAGTPFDVEMQSIPYYVEGLKAGYYAKILINGEEIGEGDYISNQNCFFNNWVGLYLHVSTKDTTVTVEPQTKFAEDVIGLTFSTSLNATEVGVDESLGTRVRVSGKIYDAGEVQYEVVSGADCAEIDSEGYINGLKDGVVVVRASITNVFGTYYSNEITITVGGGGAADDEPAGKKGCNGFAGYQSVLLFGAVVAAFSAVALKKKN